MKFNFSVPKVSKNRNEFNFDHSHTMTHNFGVMQIASAIDVKPNDDISIDMSAFTRLMPLPCPTYGGVKITHRAYHVPYTFVLRHFNDFIAMQKISTGSGLAEVHIPTFTAYDVLTALCDGDWGSSNDYFKDPPAGATKADVYGLRNQNPWSMNYTTKGRRIVSWLAQLGYKLPNCYDTDYDKNMKYDCLALFAFWKFYLDWVVPARFVLTEPRFVYIKNVLENLDTHIAYTLDNVVGDTHIDIKQFLMVPTAFLDDDFYTTAFQTPYGVENASSQIVPDDLNGLSYRGDTGGSWFNSVDFSIPYTEGDTDNRFNQLNLLSLGRLQQLVNLKKITSTSVLDFLKAEFGIAPSHDALHLSAYLGSTDSQIMIGDIMATATTDSTLGTTVVGQYAGKGIGGSNAKWRVKSNDFGIVFVTTEITTKSSYVNGVSPLRRRFQPLDFYNEKFDNVGVRAIRHSELVYSTFETPDFPGGQFDPSRLPNINSIFGFQPRYAEYKHKDDIVSGDFMFPSVNTGLDSWYLNRKFNMYEDPKINLEFLSATSDSVGSQYDRIFQNTDNIDHFYSVFQLDVHATSLMEKLFDYFRTMNDTDVDKDGLDVTIN